MERRTMIGMTAGLTLAGIVSTAARATPRPSTAPPNGGDFAFLAGEWRIANRQKKSGKWDEFPGKATVTPLLGGLVSIEELRIPARNFFGMGVRVYHLKEKQWADHWLSAGNGVVNDPLLGTFINGEGVFPSEETVDGVTTRYRSLWDRITPRSCRWTQASSTDGGKTWDYDWLMDWTRV